MFSIRCAVTVALNYEEKIYTAYFPKHNSNREKQVIHLMGKNGIILQ